VETAAGHGDEHKEKPSKYKELEGDGPREGESKNAYKARLKAEKAAKEKEEKAKIKAEKHQSTGGATGAAREEEIDPTAYFENRSRAINILKDQKDAHPYPHKYQVKLTIREFIEKYKDLPNEKVLEDVTVSVAGRITNVREQGKNLIFYDIQGDGGKLQVMCSSKYHKAEKGLFETLEHIKRGDIIGVTGHPARTKAGELSIAPGETKLLSPCLYMIPEHRVGLKDT